MAEERTRADAVATLAGTVAQRVIPGRGAE
jgi:hypothetical protein